MFDASWLVDAAIRRDGVPERALLHVLRMDRIAISDPVLDEYLDVLHRPRLARLLNEEVRAFIIQQVQLLGARFTPVEKVTGCRDPKDNKHLQLALAARADVIVSSDNDLLVLHPWRAIPVLLPAAYLARFGLSPVG